MKKKFMIFATLLGALSLGACIDDNESQSVTNVRVSKAAELKSIAAMERAKGEAEVTMAQAAAKIAAADAAVARAQAENEKAQAEMEAKKAELIELQKAIKELENETAIKENERRQAELEGELAKLQQTMEENKLELELVAAEMERMEVENEAAALRAELALKQAQKELADQEAALEAAKTQAERDAIQAERAKLQSLSWAYADAVNELIDQKGTLNILNSRLVTYKADLKNLEDTKAQAIADNESQIALNNYQIGIYKEMANYTAEEMQTLINNVEQLYVASKKLYDEYRVKYNAYYEANQAIDYTELDAMLAEIQTDPFYIFLNQGGIQPYKYENVNTDGTITTSNGTEVFFDQYLPNQSQDGYSNVLYLTNVILKHFEKEIAPGNTILQNFTTRYYLLVAATELTKDIRQIELQYENQLSYYQNTFDSYQRSFEYYTALYEGEPFDWVWDPETETYKKELRTDEAAKNLKKITEEMKAAYDEAEEADKAAAKANYEDAVQNENYAKNRIRDNKNLVAQYTARLDALKQGWKYISGYEAQLTALNDRVMAYNDARIALVTPVADLWEVSMEAYVDQSIQFFKYQAANDLLWNDEPVNSDAGNQWSIESQAVIKNEIAILESQNKRLEEQNDDLSAIEDKQQMIDFLLKQIEVQKAIVAAQEVQVAAAKAALDAVMTPAE